MIKSHIVVGTQFGDEGKGRTTDELCSQSSIDGTLEKKIVVRFSGGQQAGHNVRIGDVTHIHSNFGSGTLRGVPSYFSEHCTVYPLTIYREEQVLKSKGITPELYIHPLAKVTTPYDVAYNRFTESKNNHGSCGLGVASTMKRNNETGYKLFAIDLSNQKLLNHKLINIQKYYYSLINNVDDLETYHKFEIEEVGYFFESLNYMTFNVKSYDYIKNNYQIVIFEGSQGILLDMDHGTFPNVTFANTTSKNALEICNKLGIEKHNISIHYVTRCYQTRHGAGWMSNNDEIELINTEDEINVFNEWQKNFKIGELDYDLLNYALDIDQIYSEGIRKYLVVTCLDQRPKFKFDVDKMKHKFKMVTGTFGSDTGKLTSLPLDIYI
jgi:adenylosuccinate synthase